MKNIAVLIAAFATLGASPVSEYSGQDLTEEQIIAMERERYQRVTVSVSIQGQGPYRFLVDTGAEATVVSREIAARLSLPPAGQALVVGMVGEELTDLVDVENLTMGQMNFCCLTSPVLSKIKIGADGILGLDSLQDSRVLMDFVEDRLTVHDARENLGQSGFEIVIRAKERLGQLIITSAKVNGVRTDIIIDTGSQISIGNTALRSAIRSRHEGLAEWQDVHGNTQSGNVLLARKVDVEGIVLANLPVAIADAPPFRHLGLTDRPAMILGMQHLRMFRRVAIDFKSRRILFDLPPGVVPTSRIFTGYNASRLRDD